MSSKAFGPEDLVTAAIAKEARERADLAAEIAKEAREWANLAEAFNFHPAASGSILYGYVNGSEAETGCNAAFTHWLKEKDKTI